ncbi:MAG: 4Fe-4S dicluster domain-containing protein [candidate division NC10 bacterium]|nr:4Fe-4S dicluster domain-containing protein [candidate division NC10 bacterium]
MEGSLMQKEARILSKSHLLEWVRDLQGMGEVIAPVEAPGAPGGDFVFARLSSPEQIRLDYTHDLLPLKRFFLSPTETLLRYRYQDGIQLEAKVDETKRFFLGVRSCDMTGVRYFQNIFSANYEDPYVLKRIESATFITLACHTPPLDTCFCICIDGGPSLTEGYDLQLWDLGDRYLVEIGSEKGVAALGASERLFQAAKEKDWKDREQRQSITDQMFKIDAYFSRSIYRVTAGKVPDEVWEKVQDRCFNCGGCYYACPMCYCFQIIDCPRSATEGERQRIWDSCVHLGFQREASGHNPRPNLAETIKHRYFHKISYQNFKREGRNGCVGCGRCLIACYANIDMPSVLRKIRKGALGMSWKGHFDGHPLK